MQRAQDVDASFSLDLRVQSSLRYSDEADYIYEINGEIRVSRHPNRSEVVGTIDAYRIHGDRALNDGQDLADLCDAYEQVTTDAYAVLFHTGFEFRPAVRQMFPDAMSPEVLIIDLVRIKPAFRGRGLGLLAARRVIDLFDPEYGIVLLQPFALQFHPHRGEFADADLSEFTCDEPTAVKKLQTYWKRLGFEPIEGTKYSALCTAYKTPSVRDLSAD